MIPLEAIEAATKAFIEHGRLVPALEAAAPYLRAQALEDAAHKVVGPSDVLLDAATSRWIAMELRERAVAERGGE